MDIKLIIPKKIHNKYTYLLNRFKNLEWSGPAWYKVKTDEDVRLSLIGLGTRLNDKISRLLNLTMNNKEPKNESIDDTLIDIANYAVMGLIVRSKLWGK